MESRKDQVIIRSITLLFVFFALVIGFYSCNTTGIADVYQFTTGVQPEDGGTVTPSGGEFNAGEEVEIRAEASEEYRFVHWEGDLEGSENPITVTIDGDLELTAVFELREYALNIETQGEGMVREEVLEERSKDYEHGTVVELTAEPLDNWRFVRWEGDLEGEENPATIVIEEEKHVSAVFERREYALNIDTEGEGMVSEEVVEEKAKDYEYGTTVELTAEPEEGWSFAHWEGDLEGDENPETITVDEEKNVTAVFERMIISHGSVDGVTPSDDSGFGERSYTTLQADWDGPGGDKRWLGMNLGAVEEPESVDDDDPDRSGWYFRFNREQGYYHNGSFGRAEGFPTGPASRSSIREDSDWEEANDPCRILLDGSWRIPTEAEWAAAAEAESSASSALNLHAAGRLSPSFGHPLDSRGDLGVYWSSTQFNTDNAIVIEINSDGEISKTEPLQKHYGVPVRCIED